MSEAAGARFIEALGRGDLEAAAACFAPLGTLRALVPSALREEIGPDAILARFQAWWGDLEELEVVESEVSRFGSDTRIRYRVRGRHADDGPVEMEQEGYARGEGLFERLNLVCSGLRPAD